MADYSPMNTTRKDRTEQCRGDPYINVDVQIQPSSGAAVNKLLKDTSSSLILKAQRPT